MKFFTYLPLFIALSCSSSLKEEDCQALDWKIQGRRDAAQGLSLTMFKTYQRNCLSQQPYQAQEKLYNQGYDSGLKNYCNFHTGFILGETQELISKTCDLARFPEFLKGYKEGKKKGKKKALPKKGL
jgi:hypothetical protein